jgi:DNA ligase-1
MLFSEVAEYYDKLEAVSSRLSMVDILAELLRKCTVAEIDKIIYMTEGVLAPPFEGVEFGVAEKIMEDAIAVATGHTKEDAEKEYKKTGDMGLVAKSLAEKSKLKRMGSRKHSVSDIYDSMLKIATTSGQGSKDTKIKMLAEMIAYSSPAEAKYVGRYPIGQLRLGVGDATILEALSVMETGDRKFKEGLERAYNLCSDLGLVGKELKKNGKETITRFKVSLFKPIRPALAERLSTAEEIISKMGGENISVEQKYDGFRCQVHKQGKKIKLYSRRLEETTAMFPDIVRSVIEEVDADDAIFEGEALAFNEATSEFMPFQETIQRKRKHGIAEKAELMPLHLFAFDLMYLNGDELISEPYEKRRGLLEKMLKRSKLIKPSTRIITKSPKELDEFFRMSIENGLEGIIAKDMKAKYVAGARKFSWIKMKRSYMGELADTTDLVIIGYYLGRGSRAEFQFGGLLCATYNEKRDMFETVSRIGSGFTEAQMTELKEKLDKIKTKSKPVRVDSIIAPDFWVEPKYVVTVRADEITKSPTHTCGREKQEDGEEIGYALRFPRLVGEHTIRPDKSAEEATTTKEIKEMYALQKRTSVERVAD